MIFILIKLVIILFNKINYYSLGNKDSHSYIFSSIFELKKSKKPSNHFYLQSFSEYNSQRNIFHLHIYHFFLNSTNQFSYNTVKSSTKSLPNDDSENNYYFSENTCF